MRVTRCHAPVANGSRSLKRPKHGILIPHVPVGVNFNQVQIVYPIGVRKPKLPSAVVKPLLSIVAVVDGEING